MTTKTQGGKITGILALTLESTVALAVGDPVHVIDDYEVEKADGSKPILGHVSVANVQREAGTGRWPVSAVPGQVTVEARGFSVRTITSGGAITAGAEVGHGAAGALLAAGGGVATIGIALMGAAGAGTKIDVLVR